MEVFLAMNFPSGKLCTQPHFDNDDHCPEDYWYSLMICFGDLLVDLTLHATFERPVFFQATFLTIEEYSDLEPSVIHGRSSSPNNVITLDLPE